MTNPSILKAFERFYQRILDIFADKNHNHDNKYCTKTEIDNLELITITDIDAICGDSSNVNSMLENLSLAYQTGNGVFCHYTAQLNEELTLVPGTTYTITINGIDYECVARSEMVFGSEPNIVLGNTSALGGADTGEPFVFSPGVATETNTDGSGTEHVNYIYFVDFLWLNSTPLNSCIISLYEGTK